MNIIVKSLGVFLGITSLASCSFFAQREPARSMPPVPSVILPVVVQPQYSLEQFRDSLAVLPFGNDQTGNAISSDIEAVLARVSLNNSNYFTLVSRNKITEVLGELRLNQSGLIDDQAASQIGKLVSAKALMLGDYTNGEVQNRSYTETRTDYTYNNRICVKYDAKNQCISWEYRKYNVSCAARSSSFTLRPKVINAERGLVIYSTTMRETASDSHCEDDKSRTLATPTELRDSMIARAISRISRDIAPYVVGEVIPFIVNTEGLSEADAKTYTEGLSFILASPPRVERACTIWKSMYPTVATYQVLYALGVCAEVVNDLKSALEFYNKADEATKTPVNEISMALQRVKRKTAQ